MKRIITAFLLVLLSFSLVWAQSRPVKVIHAKRFDRSRPLRDLAKPVTKYRNWKRPRLIPNHPPMMDEARGERNRRVDPALQDALGTKAAGAVLQSWNGLRNTDNAGLVAPPDPNLDVGPNHVVEMVNLVYGIWDKSGNMLVGPSQTNTLWAGFGGNCEFSNDGDPVVVYDPLADRWLLSQFVFSQSQCVAISTTPDPTGSYFRYEFPTPGNDYPKMSAWDNAYLATIRNFSGAFNMDAAAFEKSAMLVGNPAAKMVVFDMSAALPGIDGFLPADVDGPAPAAGRNPMFMGFQSAQNRLAMFDMSIDWANVGNSTLNGPNFLSVSAIDNSVSRIPQPATTNQLDALSGFMMFRLAYRNLGTREALVASHTVDVNDYNGHAGFRWYELTSTGGAWSVRQQGTFAPDGDNRWMGSIAMNANGDIMGAYSVSSKATFPAIRFAGRNAGDPLGQFTIQEGTLQNGGGSQLGTTRWGDYSNIVVDPSDDMTFWYGTEYYETTIAWQWVTRIGSFQASPPAVAISCVPDNPQPIIIPTPGGGPLPYTMTVTNNSASSKTVDVWSYAQRNGFGKTDARFLQQGVVLGPGASQVFNITDNIPTVDPGNFTFNCIAGTFVGAQVISSSAFPWSVGVVAPSNGLAKSAGANISGWEAVAKAGFSSETSTEAVPETIVLQNNYPNPFNPTTSIRYTLNEASQVRLTIYNMLGQEVKTLVNAFQPAGFKSVSWDATNNSGRTVSAGVYLYKLEAGGVVLTKKMTLTK